MSLSANDIRRRTRNEWVSGLLVLFALAGLGYLLLALSPYETRWSSIWKYREILVSGWFVTLGIAASALVIATLVGILVVLGRFSKWSTVRGAVVVLVELARGMPLIVLILVGYHLVAPAPPFQIHNKFVIGVGILALFSGAYLGEIFRGGIESVPASQIEAARAVGFSKGQIARFVVIPQAMRRVLPAVAGQFANLIKDSSLLYVIGTPEVTYQMRQAMSGSYSNLEAYIVLALAYLIITIPMFWLSRRFERKFTYAS